MTQAVDILIVGGGPAGLAVASRLPQGTDGLLIHQDREIGVPVRTSGGSWMRDVAKLGIPRRLAHPVNSADIYSDKEHLLLDLSHDPVGILDVTGTYQWLAEQSRIPIECGTKFLSARRSDGQFEVTIRRNGGDEVLTARRIVDATGWHCAVLASLGLVHPPERRGIGIEYEYPAPNHDPNRAALFFGASTPTGYGWAFPTTSRTLRLGVGVIHPVTDKSPKDIMAHLMESPALQRMSLPRPTDFHVNAGILPSVSYDPKLVFDGVVRVGDSANMATPTLGEGIRICIERGWALGRALSDCNQGDLKAWERATQRKLALQYRLGFLANTRAASYSPDQWDRSVARMRRLPPEELIAFFRNDFTTSMIARRGAQALTRRIARLFQRAN
ncbi:flavin-dependent dehydrogenase [Litoreibacter ponti]|uniref:Flavin-dependent dehydrogenase n=1 Tax=Litoreibacter ponti TaxID=1510457 RepID=A0A2T6BNA9_9RHOB|nr:NAD(P)/FAD-dependent oxidoreductase [Litoreibacter ponti]PTX57555.1 flavin-dependent dehydrogenase [Litoreibacter ponti]